VNWWSNETKVSLHTYIFIGKRLELSALFPGEKERKKTDMMYGNYGYGWMGGGWAIIIGLIVCIAIIGAVVWLVMRWQNNKQATPQTSMPQQQYPNQMNGQEYQQPPQQSTEAYYEGEKQYSYPQSMQHPQQQERPVD